MLIGDEYEDFIPFPVVFTPALLAVLSYEVKL